MRMPYLGEVETRNKKIYKSQLHMHKRMMEEAKGKKKKQKGDQNKQNRETFRCMHVRQGQKQTLFQKVNPHSKWC